MKRIFYRFFVGCLAAILISAHSSAQRGKIDAAENGFLKVPDSIRVGCYWYWISDNISKEGVIKDLMAMRQAGITRVTLALPTLLTER